MSTKTKFEMLRRGVLSLLGEHEAVTAAFLADELKVTRQKAIWHLQKLAEVGLCHHALTVREGSRHFVWAEGTSTQLTDAQLTSKVVGQLRRVPVKAVANTQNKTAFVGGINPWAGEVMK